MAKVIVAISTMMNFREMANIFGQMGESMMVNGKIAK